METASSATERETSSTVYRRSHNKASQLYQHNTCRFVKNSLYITIPLIERYLIYGRNVL